MSTNGVPVVLTVHGTFAGVADERFPNWWQTDGQLAADLNARFPLGGIDVQTFPWKDDETTGPNRESERQRAGRLLFERVQEFERAGRPYHLVGHSHGGSVIWHALKYSAARNQRLKHLKSWTSISTPFLELGPDGSVWRRVAAALAVVAALYWMGIWELVPKVISAFRRDGLTGLTTSIPLIEDLPDIRTALGDASFFALIAVFGAIALLFALWLVLPFGDCIRYSIAGPRLRQSELKAAQWYEPLWLGLAHLQDEAIAGLKATLIRAPDLVIRRKRGLFGLVLRLFKPAARATDQFAWSILIRKAQGCDIYGAVIRRVATAPEPFKNDVTPLPSNVAAQMEAQADIAASRVLARFRDRLQTLSDQADIAALSAVLAGTYDDDSLIHTSMFDNESVRAAIADRVASPGAVSSRAPVRNVVARFGTRAVALSIAKAIAAVGIVAVVTVIAGQGYQIYYAESRLAAAERIIARFDEPAFMALSSGATAGNALVRAVRLGVSFERALAAAAKLRGASSNLESFQLLMRETAFQKRPDELLRWVLSPLTEVTFAENHRSAGQVAIGLTSALNALVASGHPPSEAAARLLDAASIQIDIGLKGSYRSDAYKSLIPAALALGEPAYAIVWAGIAFEGDPECKDWDAMIENAAAAAATSEVGILVLEQIIRKCNPKTEAEDRRRVLRQSAVGGLRSCEFAKPLLDQASVNRVGPGAGVRPRFVECLALDGRRNEAEILSAETRTFKWDTKPREAWRMGQALKKVNLVSEADQWVKIAIEWLNRSGVDLERNAEDQFADDALKLNILRATNPEQHAAFLKEIATEGDAFTHSRQFAASRARLRQMYAENFEKSRSQPCVMSAEDTSDLEAIVGILKIQESKNTLSLVIAVLSVADQCKFAVRDALYKGMFDIVSANNDVEARAAALARLAAFQSTLRLGMTGADTAGLPDAILKGYVAAVDRHRPSARDRSNSSFEPLQFVAFSN